MINKTELLETLRNEMNRPWNSECYEFRRGLDHAIALVEQLDDPREDMRKLVEALKKIAEARHPTSKGDVFASYGELREYAVEALTTYKEKYGD